MAEERRLVTILFSDVAGSTALGEELDPEDLRALLGRYYAIAKDVVAEHGRHAREVHRRRGHGGVRPADRAR
jgi:class 3 adenylate cyclase